MRRGRKCMAMITLNIRKVHCFNTRMVELPSLLVATSA
jgi:hypothetical protein